MTSNKQFVRASGTCPAFTIYKTHSHTLFHLIFEITLHGTRYYCPFSEPYGSERLSDFPQIPQQI